jgi:hypothetical protein
MDNVSELQDLASGEFSSMRAWLNEGHPKNVQSLGLGVAYYNLRLWSKAVQHLKEYTENENFKPGQLNLYRQILVSGSIEMNEFDQAIALFGLGGADNQGSKLLVALKQHGSWEGASNILEGQLAEQGHSAYGMLVDLCYFEIALARQHCPKTIEYYENKVKHRSEYDSAWWSWQCLADLYKAIGDATGEANVLQRAVANGHRAKWGLGCLRNTKSDEIGRECLTSTSLFRMDF